MNSRRGFVERREYIERKLYDSAYVNDLQGMHYWRNRLHSLIEEWEVARGHRWNFTLDDKPEQLELSEEDAYIERLGVK